MLSLGGAEGDSVPMGGHASYTAAISSFDMAPAHMCCKRHSLSAARGWCSDVRSAQEWPVEGGSRWHTHVSHPPTAAPPYGPTSGQPGPSSSPGHV